MSDQQESGIMQSSKGETPTRSKRFLRPGCVAVVLLLLIGVGIFSYSRFTAPAGVPTPAPADGVANFRVGEHPVLVLSGVGNALFVHVNAQSHVVTLRAVGYSSEPENKSIPYTKSREGQTYTFDVSDFRSDKLDLAIPKSSDLQLNTTTYGITVNGINGKMFLSTNSELLTVVGSTLTSGSSLNANNGSIVLNQTTFTGETSLVGSGITATGVTFRGTATLSSNNDNLTLTQDTFEDTASLFAGFGTISANHTTFLSTLVINSDAEIVGFTSSTFEGKVTVSNVRTLTVDQSTFNAGALINASGSVSIAATFGKQGAYQITANNGDIDLTLASEPPFHLEAYALSGDITCDLSTIHVTPASGYPDYTDAHASGDVGNPGKSPSLTFHLRTNYSSIRLHQG